MTFPVIVFERSDKKIFSLDYKFLMGDMRFVDVAFKNVEVVDSAGKVFKLTGVSKASGLRLLESIKLVGLIVKLIPIIEGDVKDISLSELQDRIFTHVSTNAKHWLVLDTLEGMKERIYSSKNFEELIKIFR